MPNTDKTYASGFKSWSKYADTEGIDALGSGDEAETILTEWVGTNAVRNHGTARTYLSGALHERSKKRGIEASFAHSSRRSKILKASRRTTQGPRGSGPIYGVDLEEEEMWMGGPGMGTFKQIAVLGAALLMLVCAMRVGEVAPERYKTKAPPKKVRGKWVLPPRSLRRRDLKFTQDDDGVRAVCVHLARSKWKNKAVRFKIHETESTVDPYRAIREAYVQTAEQGPNAPVFTRSAGGPALVASDISTLCKRITARGWDPEEKKRPHGFRVGTARSLMTSGVRRQGIDMWCRWESGAGDQYLKATPMDLQAMLTPNDWTRPSEMVMKAAAVKSEIRPSYADGRRRNGCRR